MSLYFSEDTNTTRLLPRMQVVKQPFLLPPAATQGVATDLDFDLLASGAVTLYSRYLQIATDGSTNDECILGGVSAGVLGKATWAPEYKPRMILDIATEAATTYADAVIWFGFKLTNTSVIATDADQVMFRYDYNDGYSDWRAIASVAGSDTNHPTGVDIAASTRFRFAVDVDAKQIARFYVATDNDDFVMVYKHQTTLTSATALLPFIGIKEASGAVAQSIKIYGLDISMDQQ